MPEIGSWHPHIVHFVIAVGLLGIALRLISLIGRPAWISPAATVLLLIGAGASVLAVRSGDDAHGPVERVPGARDAVVEHQEWGEKARNTFLWIAALELVGMVAAGQRWQQGAHALSAVMGLYGAFAVYETAEHGGDLVYNYAGGVGIRSGETGDLNRLLTAALYHNLQQDRRDGRFVDASRLVDELASRNPDDLAIHLLLVESVMLDRNDPARARALLAATPPPAEDARLVLRHGLLLADAFEGLGLLDSARVHLEALKEQMPDRAVQIDARLARVGQPPA